ncbi:hypothetical protein GLOIN_2v1769522 [Rhizophagus clarus]|uniref:Uncharacterized protein n=1 Tax=Rhizophagus clarus TaxID=94130 RepID=A0A8H3L0W0_9GLOM|nr:hypothetical protein GLOIN_2v1769522 [Rhizophagus clarus]
MARFTCAFIKKDNTICGNRCYDPTGCYRHWKLYEKNQKKKPYLFSDEAEVWGAEALQPANTSELLDEALRPRIPEALISESDVSSASIHEHLFPTSLQLFADSLRRDLTDST